TSEETVRAIRHQLGLDRPLPVQYVAFIADLARGRLGRSFMTTEPVSLEIRSRMMPTLLLMASSLLVGLLIGFLGGIASATRPGSLFDMVASPLVYIGISLPTYWIGLVAIWLFAVRWGLLPSIGSGSPQHLVLPALTLGIASASTFAKMVRGSMREVLGRPYIQTARAKGLEERRLILRHALKNALIPTITLVGLEIGWLLTGAVVVETVFSWPGLGRLLIQSIASRDIPLIQGIVLMMTLVFVLSNALVDALYILVDPRVQYA
ncbi:MAG: peptide ABC transporter, partial [Acidobacteria bacterium RBG_16_64_8]